MKYLTLDIGNVLCKVVFDDFKNSLSKTLNITIEDASYFMNRTQKLHDLGCTILEDELRDHFKIKSPLILKDLIDAWHNSIVPNKDIINNINILSEKYDIKIALLSNIGLEHAKLMRELLGSEFYDKAIKHFSCFVGARKPSLLFYQSFLTQYPEFKGCLYIDDLEENLFAASDFGFKVKYFDLQNYERILSPQDGIEQINKIILTTI